jgi:hypothetical protein
LGHAWVCFHLLASISRIKDMATAMNEVYRTLPERVATTARISSSKVGPVSCPCPHMYAVADLCGEVLELVVIER